VDDVMCATSKFDEHLLSLRDLFNRLRRTNLVLKPSKTYLGYDEIEFLAYMVSENRLETNVCNVDKILRVQKPTMKKKLREVIELINFYWKFISKEQRFWSHEIDW